MLRSLQALSFLILTCATALPAQRASRLTTTAPTACVHGRVTVHQTLGRTFGEHPIVGLSLFLFKVQDSRPFQELQRRCRKAVGQTKDNPVIAYEVCMNSLSEAAELVKKMPATATGLTNDDGFYVFENVPARGRYQVVGIKMEEDHPVIMVALTAKLKPGDFVRVNLSENDPWTDAIPPKDSNRD